MRTRLSVSAPSVSRFLVILTGLIVSSCQFCFGAPYTLSKLGFLSDDPNFQQTITYAINRSGQVTGYSELSSPSIGIHLISYSVGTLHDISPSGPDSVGTGINDSGLIVGYTFYGGRAFLYDGTMHDLGTLNGSGIGQSYATGINNLGNVVGDSTSASQYMRIHAFVYQNGSMQELGTFPSLNFFDYATLETHATAINSLGQIAGYASAPSEFHASIYTPGPQGYTIQDLGVGAGVASKATALNDLGDVAGDLYFGNGITHVFLYSNGVMHDLGVPSDATTVDVTGINNKGQIIGTASAFGSKYPFLYSDGKFQNLNLLVDPMRSDLTEALAINDAGQITGRLINAPVQDGFLLTPTPEPSSLVLAALGFAGLTGWRWRRRKRSQA